MPQTENESQITILTDEKDFLAIENKVLKEKLAEANKRINSLENNNHDESLNIDEGIENPSKLQKVLKNFINSKKPKNKLGM